jgi:hypothetical protein
MHNTCIIYLNAYDLYMFCGRLANKLNIIIIIMLIVFIAYYLFK